MDVRGDGKVSVIPSGYIYIPKYLIYLMNNGAAGSRKTPTRQGLNGHVRPSPTPDREHLQEDNFRDESADVRPPSDAARRGRSSEGNVAA